MEPFLYLKLFARAPIYDLVFAYLSPRSLIRLARTCRDAYIAVAAFKSRAFNINRHFSRYFSDPVAFRSLQAKTDTLVSGSNALQFFDRTFYPESDLDLYTHPGHSREVARFLIENQGYTYVPRETQEAEWTAAIRDDWDGTRSRVSEIRTLDPPGSNHAYPISEIEAVWTFEKKEEDEGETLKVQIVEASSSPVQVILGFHTTCVMNVISADAAYALYPIATFEERSCLGMPSSTHARAAVRKYARRGWRVYFMLATPNDAQNAMESPFLPRRVRWVGDEHTWVIPLDQTGVRPRPPLSPTSVPLGFDSVRCNGWRLRYCRGNALNGYECHYYPVQTTVFRYNYAIPDEDLALEIRDWAMWQGRHSHSMVEKANWAWFDADLPSFLNRKCV